MFPTNHFVIKKNSLWQCILRIKSIFFPPLTVTPIHQNVEIWRDVRVAMRDGIELSLNIYKPKQNSKFPALINLHPYCKDNLPQKGHLPLQYRVIRQTAHITFSTETSWEAPDPEFWVEHGYAVINVDKRGFGKSGGIQNMFDDAEAQDYYDIITWVAHQEWSSGKVGLLGVSYLAISQYKVAALNPAPLCAICPWEGFSDIYKDAFYPGGIREDGFVRVWSRGVKERGDIKFRQQQLKHTLRDDFYLNMVPDLPKIKVPTLICASFSDHQLHTRGSFRAFEQIESEHKWLYTHRSGKWARFYSPEAKMLQLKFFDYFLKGIKNDMLAEPRIRIEVQDSRSVIYKVRHEKQWPLVDTQWTELYLNVATQTLEHTPNTTRTSSIQFITDKESVKFSYKFDKDTEIIGPIKLTLYLSLEQIDDINIFVGIQKFHQNCEVNFEGSYGFANDVLSKGFMKASLRKNKLDTSSFYDPEHDFNDYQPLASNEIVKLEIGLLPSATFFAKEDELRLVIQGVPLLKYGKLHQIGQYEKSVRGICKLWDNPSYQSSMTLPFIDCA